MPKKTIADKTPDSRYGFACEYHAKHGCWFYVGDLQTAITKLNGQGEEVTVGPHPDAPKKFMAQVDAPHGWYGVGDTEDEALRYAIAASMGPTDDDTYEMIWGED